MNCMSSADDIGSLDGFIAAQIKPLSDAWEQLSESESSIPQRPEKARGGVALAT